MRKSVLLASVLLPLALPGCGSLLSEGTADVAGVAAAGAASAVTDSAAAAAAIGLGVRSVAAEGLRYVNRRVHREEQDAIAAAAGPLPLGGVTRWAVRHSVPLEDDEAGDVTVSRAFGTGPVACKELVFSVERARRNRPVERSFFITTICQDGTRWRWASAEPATERWGALQ